MPRIRKKTSKRGTTNQREKIKHKVSETRKKRKKETRKNPNPQWKSKHTKDPGIPNNFPYKDEILAEVAEQRRQAEEAKQLKKELKKAKKASEGAEHDNDGDEQEASGDEGGYDGVTAVSGTRVASGSVKGKGKEAEPVEDEEVPVLINPDWPNLGAVLDAADVVIEVVDARDPASYRLKHIEETVKATEGKKLLVVLNKIDACPRESVSAWATALRAEHSTFLFRSASAFLASDAAPLPVPAKGKGKERADDALGLAVVCSALEKLAGEKETPLVVAVTGVTNAGKSSFVNSLLRKAAVPVYKLSTSSEGPSTTTHAQEVTLEIAGKSVRLVDTPGVAWVHSSSSDADGDNTPNVRARDILTRNKGRIDRLKDPEPVVDEIVRRAGRDDLMMFYNLPAFADKDTPAFLSALARANGLIKKGGVLDVLAASRIVLRDWNTGKFPRYAVPPAGASAAAPADAAFAELYAKDEAILATLKTRKELRKGAGLVKLEAGLIDERHVELEAPWVAALEDSDDEDEEIDELEEHEDDAEIVSGDEDAEGDDDDDAEEDELDEDEDEDEVDEVEEPVQPHGKRKRGSPAASKAPPAKRVAFAPEPKNTKQARSAAGARGAAVAASRKAQRAEVKTTKVAAPTAKAAKAAKLAQAKKAANAAPSTRMTRSSDKPGEEAYDFKKFF